MSQETTFDEVYNYACEQLTQSIANAQGDTELLEELTKSVPLNYQTVTPPNNRSKKFIIDLSMNNVNITFNRCTINYYTQLMYGPATLHKGIVNLNHLYKIIKAVGDMIANSTSPHMNSFRESRKNVFQLFGQKTIPYPDVLIFFSPGYTSNSQKPLVKKEDSEHFRLEVTQKNSQVKNVYNVYYICTVDPAFETETVLRLKQVECNPATKKINIIFEAAKYSIEKDFIASIEEYATIAPKPKASSKKHKQPVVTDSESEEEVVRKPESRSRLRSVVEDSPKVVSKSKSKKVNSDSEEELAKQVSKKVVVQSESESEEEEQVKPKSTKTKKVVVQSESEEEQVKPKSTKTKKVVVVQSESEEEYVQPKSTKTKKVDKASREDLGGDKRSVLADRSEKKTKTRHAKDSDSEEDVKTIPLRRNK